MSEQSTKGESPPLSTTQVWFVGLGLFVLSMMFLMLTMDVGYSRDEAFYFEYGQSYDDWLIQVEAADDVAERAEVLGRHGVLKTWKGNFEHPPLMKSLFGISRRYLAKKNRDLHGLKDIDGKLEARVVRLTPSDGFTEGAQVEVLAPLQVGEGNKERTVLAAGTVRERGKNDATIVLHASEEVDLLKTCAPKTASPPPISPCQANETKTLAVLDEGSAMRLPGIVSGALAVVLTFLLGLHLFGWQIGVFGGLAFLFIPRNFYHAHLACFDMPIVAATLATFYAFWRSLDDRRWAIVAGFVWGVALLIKHNAFFLPVPLIICWLWLGRHEILFRWNRGRPSLKLPALPVAFLVMPPIALTLFFVAWPRLWYDPFIALTEYFSFHLEHAHYLQWYFGEPLQVPPFPIELPLVLTVYTVPLTLVLLTIVGLVLALRFNGQQSFWTSSRDQSPPSQHERATFFAVMNGFFPILLISLPSVPIFGGVKHWMTAMPFLMLLAGYGLFRLTDLMLNQSRTVVARVVVVGTATIILAGGASESVRGLPYGTGYYNRLVAGGLQGAADNQMMRLYWGLTSHEALHWVNQSAPPGARIYFQNTPAWAIEFYQRDGELRRDIRAVRSAHGADIALVEPQKSFTEMEDLSVRRSFQVPGPAWTVAYDGVPMLRIYVRDSAKLLTSSQD